MTDDTLKDLLADYVAPTEDGGFSEAVMKTLEAEAQDTLVDIHTLTARPGRVWRSWLVALVLGVTAGLLWSRSGVSLPDMGFDLGITWPASADWMLYALCAAGIGVSLILVESEAL